MSGTGSLEPGSALGDIIVGVMSVRERLSEPALRAPGSLYASQRRIFLLSTSAFQL
jgi:hypothetical protein